MPRPPALPRILAEKDPAPSRLDGPQSDRQALFIRYYSQNGISGAEAARLAGYADGKAMAYYLLGQPHIRAAVRAEREKTIQGDLANKALSTLAELMEPGTPAPVRLGASRTALEMAGHLGIKEAPTALENKPLGELTVNELEELVKQGTDFLASAKIIPAKVLPSSRPE